MKVQRCSEQEIAARELRRACIHEVGHVVVLRALGGDADPRVWRNDPDRVKAGERAWCGQTEMRIQPGTWRSADPAWIRMYGLAGLVAEAIADGEQDAGCIAFQIDTALEAEEVSATDAAAMGDDWWDTVPQVFALLRENWSEVQTWAAELERSASA